MPTLPRLKCEVFEEGNVFDEMERCFTNDARRKELMDVYELIFRIHLYEESDAPMLSEEFRDMAANDIGYTMTVTSKSIRFTPRIQEVTNNEHRKQLVKIQKLLSFDSEPATKLLRKG